MTPGRKMDWARTPDQGGGACQGSSRVRYSYSGRGRAVRVVVELDPPDEVSDPADGRDIDEPEEPDEPAEFEGREVVPEAGVVLREPPLEPDSVAVGRSL